MLLWHLFDQGEVASSLSVTHAVHSFPSGQPRQDRRFSPKASRSGDLVVAAERSVPPKEFPPVLVESSGGQPGK